MMGAAAKEAACSVMDAMESRLYDAKAAIEARATAEAEVTANLFAAEAVTAMNHAASEVAARTAAEAEAEKLAVALRQTEKMLQEQSELTAKAEVNSGAKDSADLLKASRRAKAAETKSRELARLYTSLRAGGVAMLSSPIHLPLFLFILRILNYNSS